MGAVQSIDKVGSLAGGMGRDMVDGTVGRGKMRQRVDDGTSFAALAEAAHQSRLSAGDGSEGRVGMLQRGVRKYSLEIGVAPKD